MKTQSFLLGLWLFLAGSPVQSQESDPTIASKYDQGYVMLMGGGISEQQAAFINRFCSAERPLVVIPTAYSDKAIQRDTHFRKVRERFRKLGIDSVQMLHTRSRAVANTPAFVQPLEETKAVFFLGGKTAHIVDAYKNTAVQEALEAILQRGGLVAGVSAGSGCQASYFTGKDSLHPGFEFLKNTVIMNHFLRKNKQFDHTDFFQKNRHYLGLGIDEGTALIIHKGVGEVVGSSYVAIYDGTDYVRSNDEIVPLPSDSERFYLLQQGDRYDLNQRQVISHQRLQPIELPLAEYVGAYTSSTNDFGLQLTQQNNGLLLTNSWGWKPYLIVPLEKDVFYATNRPIWFRFRRSAAGAVIGVDKLKSVLLGEVIHRLGKL
ncbi:cyanophycinase [Flavobacteriaceae bacterium TP-CH-4]|uniref:Cyanophycinase n=1 Tax=Pelagihabitans pacificus TaxID=2696054 RepID=A0A967E529_9FLAO|nr:cyanophycinase [Pelagihabitans pacificus]NHF58125.1 cyanophycinase [Pelagihabitans pacificus]